MIQNQGLAVLLDKDTGLLKSIGVVRPDGITMVKVRVASGSGWRRNSKVTNLTYKPTRPTYRSVSLLDISLFLLSSYKILIKIFLPEGEPNVSVVRRNERK